MFADDFGAAHGKPLSYGDRVVEMRLTLLVQPQATMRVVRERERRRPVQGLELKIDAGTL